MASTSQAVLTSPSRAITGHNGLIDKYFYFAMSLLVLGIVLFGFGHTIDGGLLRPQIPRPFILWIHAAVFSAWVLFFILQSALVRTHNVRVHRTLGWFGAALGASMIPLGVTTAIVLDRFEVHQLHKMGRPVFQSIQLNDILSFTIFFTLAVYWRKKPELHRRFIFIATAVLLSAAFGRFPYLGKHSLFYVGVDAVILFGVVRDLLVNRRVHIIYRIALPALILSQATAVYLYRGHPAWWAKLAHTIVS
jgi:hypothetical protein